MSKLAEELKSQLKTLSHDDKVELTTFLLDCLQIDEDPEWQAAWAQELNRREATANTGERAYHSAEKVLDELDRKFS